MISSLGCYAKINTLGFIETPYRKVENGKVDFSAKVMMDKEVEEETEETVENIDQETQNQAPLESHEDTLNKNEEE